MMVSHGWGVGDRWWQSYLFQSPMSRYYVGVLKSLALAGRPVLRDLPVHLKLSSNSNCSLHGYIRTCQLHLGTFFYSLFSFYPWGWPTCVSTIQYTIFTPVMHYGSLCKFVIMFMLMLDSYTLASFGKNINNDTLNTSGWNATIIDPCACRYFL